MQMMKRIWKRLTTIGLIALCLTTVVGTWFYVAIGIPNLKLAQDYPGSAGWRHKSDDELRTVCQQVLSHRIGNHHDAFVALEGVANRDSIPYLIGALKWQQPPNEDGTVVCTTHHCARRLWELTGMWFNCDYYEWKKWWNETGCHLTPTELQDQARKARKAANKAPEDAGAHAQAPLGDPGYGISPKPPP